MKPQLKLANYLRMPSSGNGAKIGLFGGSFNPPHEGHIALCDLALKRLELDQIWWIVTPGNPLKDLDDLPSLETRIAWCEDMITHPAIKITAFEAEHNVRYTADTLRLLTRQRAGLNFVWLMGSDNLANFHQWQDWRDIADRMPIAIIDRPGTTLSHHSAPAAQALAKYRIDEYDAPLLANMKPPAWVFLHGPRNSLSSTKLRKSQN